MPVRHTYNFSLFVTSISSSKGAPRVTSKSEITDLILCPNKSQLSAWSHRELGAFELCSVILHIYVLALCDQHLRKMRCQYVLGFCAANPR